MKDSAVSPVLLLSPARQRRLIDGLISRVADSRHEHTRLLAEQNAQHQDIEHALASQLAAVKQNCLQDRQSTLQQWDHAQEEAIAAYETATIKTRDGLRRVTGKYRKARNDQESVITGKVEKRVIAIENQYNQYKDQPKKKLASDVRRLDQMVAGGDTDLEWARHLTMRRLNRYLEVTQPKDPFAEFEEVAPTSVKEAEDLVQRQNRRLKSATKEMQKGFASAVVDSFYLPAAVAVFIVLWSITVLLMRPESTLLWMIGSVPAAGMFGMAIYGVLLIPLRKMTRKLHPLTERIRHSAEVAAKIGKRLSAKSCKQAEHELVERRKAQLADAKRWEVNQLAEVDEKIKTAQAAEQSSLDAQLERVESQFRSGFAELQQTMRQRADDVASNITETLSQTDSEAVQRIKATLQTHKHTLSSLSHRLNVGLKRGMMRIAAANDLSQYRFPTWQEILTSPPPPHDSIDFLPIGQIRLGNRLKCQFDEALGYMHDDEAPDEANILSKIQVPEFMPLAIHRREHSGLIVETPPEKLDEAIDIAHQVLWRLLSGAVPGRAKVTLIDANSRGQHFAPFMALADHDPQLINHRVWTSGEQITQRLAELTHHVENVLQASLRDRFKRIEDYNEVAGSLAEPYHAIAAVGFPSGLSQESYSNLMSLIQSGARCGVFVILVVEQGKTWPVEMPLIDSNKLIRIVYDEDLSQKQTVGASEKQEIGSSHWLCKTAGLDDLEFWPAHAPPPGIRETLVRRIGKGALESSRVVVDLQSLLPNESIPESGATGSTDNGIAITIGSQGAGRTRSLLLGEGVRQHVLIAGKTGSGKSTLLHSIITAGTAQYTPDQLQFYLLDFKKGVEFKVYADSGLPHARVIGIESEREFGRSVLQRLDAELTTRGEAFRDASVQELGEFRAKCPDTLMPRIILIVDEFQELFTRDDSLAGDCTSLLDRLIRQGRSFGIHIILSSQSLAGANSLPRATLGQMAVRVAMQCSESDAALILADDNTAAKMLNRPGEAIYNDASGLIEGNYPFQVAWLAPDDHERMLQTIAQRDAFFAGRLDSPIVFEGNRPSRFTAKLANAALASVTSSDKVAGLLGESVELGPPTTLRFQSDTGRNAVVVSSPKMRVGIVGTFIASARTHTPDLKIALMDGSRADDGPSIADWVRECQVDADIIRSRDAEPNMISLAGLVAARVATESGKEIESPVEAKPDPFAGSFSLDGTSDSSAAAESNHAAGSSPDESSPGSETVAVSALRQAEDDGRPVLLIVDALDRLRDLRQSDTMDFSMEAKSRLTGSQAFQAVLRDGPAVGVFVLVTLPSAEVLSRWLPRQSQNDLELRLVGPINAADSSLLIDSPAASELSPATMILYDDADGRTTKFRICDPPTLAAIESLHSNS
ncbi:DNA segregation ATPase FtsK/SpoIIIE, S-DNA-T family [Neorhodopirellula lusitana]|uniref:DNA segregation ATPase FtsK/SpoIIIE, S-DNA-T family n=1 Tax=Neorhodopirellula lusitana TaxID=445327 RepID=A0ABY1Q030_9BACT|nr:FtsK/SpoIIIE domain-containing protein [Neorhodopirellula lusitana]SMP53398.1 DNA segregation ATPase FtsK/SpoIIIE, S-DNA-T family [Neorhodopirellula lusitana]